MWRERERGSEYPPQQKAIYTYTVKLHLIFDLKGKLVMGKHLITVQS